MCPRSVFSPRHLSITASLWGLILLSGLFLLPLVAAQPEAESGKAGASQTFFDNVDVNVVNVDVYVTDKEGNRVEGLKREDFELFEDSRPVKITNFFAVNSAPRALTAREDLTVEDLESDRPIELTRLDVPEHQRLSLILYFDNLYLKPFNRNKVILKVREFLFKQVRPGDQVMLVSFDRSLRVRHPFTTDPRAIADSLYEIETVTAYGVQAATQRRDVIRELEQSEDARQAESHVDFYAKNRFNDLSSSLRALKELVGSLGGLPGRKMLLHVSDGLPMTAADDLFLMLDQLFPRSQFSGKLLASRYSARRKFKELVARANANRVAFYTLEAAGLRSHGSLSAEHGSSQGGGSMIEIDTARTMNITEPLQVMALDTGGLASFNTNNIAGALDQMALDMRSFYSLGYIPSHSSEGRYHDIEVKVRRPGLKVRHRTGYRDKSAEARVNEGTMSSLLYGNQANPLGVVVEFGGAKPAEDGHLLVPVRVKIPIGKISLVPYTGQHQGKLRVAVAVVDGEGRTSPIEQTPIPINIPDVDIEVARSKFYVYSVELLMRKGPQRVAIGVRDDVAGETSYLREAVQI